MTEALVCCHCRTPIRWTETMGWIHGEPGSGQWNAWCDDSRTIEAEPTKEWLGE